MPHPSCKKSHFALIGKLPGPRPLARRRRNRLRRTPFERQLWRPAAVIGEPLAGPGSHLLRSPGTLGTPKFQTDEGEIFKKGAEGVATAKIG